ncbi:MAG: DUF3536 domain-containing protein [Candidatus Nanoarchaeia archaeon]|nr:DUF3536 domain-containing protein [Candidatus Nanoarchaeia archaeon]
MEKLRSKEETKPYINFALHAHQPLRYNGISINEEIYKRCYLENIKLKNLEKVSVNISGSVLLDLLENKNNKIYSELAENLREVNEKTIKEYAISNFLLQGSVFHSIIPLLPEKSRILQYEWSKTLFEHFFKSEHKGVWLPEQAFDKKSLEFLANQKEEWTILPQWASLDKINTSVPYKTQSGENMIILFYDKSLSDKISWRQAVWNFSDFIKGKNKDDLSSWNLAMDIETFGEHGRDKKEKEDGPWWLNNLIYYQIPGAGYKISPIQSVLFSNNLIGGNKDISRLEDVLIKNSGSWSCLCERHIENIESELRKAGLIGEYGPYLENLPKEINGLLRWGLFCGCVNNGETEKSLWKLPFKSGLTSMLEELHGLYGDISKGVINKPFDALADYINVKIRAVGGNLKKSFLDNFVNKHFIFKREDDVKMFFYMAESIFHAEASQTSCGFYWENYDRLEPNYNTIHAANSIALFKEGLSYNKNKEYLKKIEQISKNLEKDLEKTSKKAIKLYNDVLDGYGKKDLLEFSYGGDNKLKFDPKEHTHIEKIVNLYEK